jgi:hypothetical protein
LPPPSPIDRKKNSKILTGALKFPQCGHPAGSKGKSPKLALANPRNFGILFLSGRRRAEFGGGDDPITRIIAIKF